jgi:dTDP-4-amino-4,6-dideoxygalactose transaminase
MSTSGLHCVDHQKLKKFFNTLDSESVREILKQRLCEYHESKFVVLFNTGFWALVIAIKSELEKYESRRVLMPSLTYRRLADAVYWAGGVPVFVDVDENSLAIDYSNLNDILKSDNLFGLLLLVQPIIGSVDLSPFIELCKRHRIGFVVDSVESVHDHTEIQRCGSYSVPEVFSCHASKFVNGFEGGYICTDDYEYAKNLEEFCDQSSTFHVGMSVAHAAIAYINLENIDEFYRHNLNVYRSYLDLQIEFADNGFEIMRHSELFQSGYKNIVAKYKDDSLPEGLIASLNRRGIGARAYYQPPLHLKGHAFNVEIAGALNISESVGQRLINLPCGWRFDPSDTAFVLESIADVVHGN